MLSTRYHRTIHTYKLVTNHFVPTDIVLTDPKSCPHERAKTPASVTDHGFLWFGAKWVLGLDGFVQPLLLTILVATVALLLCVVVCGLLLAHESWSPLFSWALTAGIWLLAGPSLAALLIVLANLVVVLIAAAVIVGLLLLLLAGG